MGLIKSTNVPPTISQFSMRDIENQAKTMLLRARHQADQLLAAAQQEAEQLKSAAKTEGFADGQREGLARGMEEGRKAGEQQALNDARAQLQQAVSALSQGLTQFEARRFDLEAVALHDVVQLAISIARRVTKRQGMLDPHILEQNLGEAMKLVVQQSDLRVAIHPSQRQTLDSAMPKLALAWPALKHAEVIEDETLSPGGCRVCTRHGHVDADLDRQLDRIVLDLLPDANGGPA